MGNKIEKRQSERYNIGKKVGEKIMGKGMKRNEHMEETTEGKRIRTIKKA